MYKKNFKKPREWPIHTVYSDVEVHQFKDYDLHKDQESVGNVHFYCKDPKAFAEEFVRQSKQVAQVQIALDHEQRLLDIYRNILLSAPGLKDKMIIGDLLYEQDDDGPGKFTLVERYEG